MGRYLGPSCKLCRAGKTKLFLKAEKCYTNCILDKGIRKNIGSASAQTRKMTEYARHLNEKQKLKRMLCLNEETFKNYFRIASRMKGLTGKNLLFLLERRLDNTLRKMGFVQSIKSARQLISHGHILVNNKIIKTPGYLVNIGDKILFKKSDKFKENLLITQSLQRTGDLVPSWLTVNKENLEGQVVNLPKEEDFSFPIDVSLIVELYSK